MILLRHIGELYSLEGAAKKKGRGILPEDLSLQKKAALVIDKDKIVWVGPEKSLPASFAKKKLKEASANHRTVIPGFVDCHTHLVFAGDRSAEFELRQQGMSYQEIAKNGGGILSTMKATREISKAQLIKSSQQKVQRALEQGVTTLEIKTGYALNLKDEIKCLEVIQQLEGPRLVSTFLGAHARPPEHKTNESYLDYLAREILPVVKKKKLASRVDIFWDQGFFEGESAKKYMQAAKDLGFDLVLHADQLSNAGATEAGIALGARSVDHAIQIPDSLIPKLAKSQTVAVLLPAADVYLKCPFPPARKLIDAGVCVALSTDFNPGSSPTQDLQWIGLLARLEMKMSFPEVLSAMTVGAGHALGLQREIGSLEIGKSADLQILDGELSELFYSPGRRPCEKLFSRGKSITLR